MLPLNDRLDFLDEFASSMNQSGQGYLDIELQAYQRRPDITDLWKLKRRMIVSAHDFHGRPSKLMNILVEMTQRIADVHKVKLVFKDGAAYDPAKLLESVRGQAGLR